MSTLPFKSPDCSTANGADGNFYTFCAFLIPSFIWLLVNAFDKSLDGMKFKTKGMRPINLILPEPVMVLK